METTVTTVYDFGMSKLIHIQVKGVPTALMLPGDKVEVSGDKLKVSKDGKPVGEFSTDSIDGWWMTGQDER